MGILLRLGSAYALAKNIIAEKSDYTDTDEYSALKKDFPDYGFPAEEEKPLPSTEAQSATLPEMTAQQQPIPQTEQISQPQLQPQPQPQPQYAPRYGAPNNYNSAPPPPANFGDAPRYANNTAHTGYRNPPPSATKFGDPPRFSVRDTDVRPRNYQRERNNRSTLIGLLIAFGIFGFGFVAIAAILTGFLGTASFTSEATAVTQMAPPPAIEYAAPEAVNKAVFAAGAPVYAFGHTGEIFGFSLYNTGANVTIIRDGEFKIESDSAEAVPGVFDVDFTDGYLSVSAFPEAGNVTIHIPDNITENLYVSSDGGKVTMQNLSAPTLELYGTDASFELIDNTFTNGANIYTTDCDYYGSNNTFNGILNVDGYDSE
jgi:hypothetical protein